MPAAARPKPFRREFNARARLTVCLLVTCVLLGAGRGDQDWTNYVRIGAYSLKSDNAEKIVANATASDVSGIEVDNDIPGRYESFLNPEEKLKAIRAVAEKAHAAGSHAFVYIAGLECITANADKTPHSLAKDHPDWLQRKITGETAIFGGGTAFWIAKGDEDVWVSPYAPEWRKTYMERVRQIAATKIDGIYVDIPYWMTHFEGWEDSWASFDDYTIAAFKQQTGLDAKHDLKLGDLADSNFRKWVDFRIQTITDFMAEIDRTAKAVNPEIKTIPEIYPGIEEAAVRVGADVYSLYGVVDAIAHEYEYGEGDHMASSRTPLDWFCYQVGMHSFRAFAQGKATWILNYSWDGDKSDRRESMMNLAMSEVMANANFWDAPGHVMAGSNDLPTRKRIFSWIKEHEKTLYSPRTPIDPIGVYFSPATRNYFANDFIDSYRGILIWLMQEHREFQVVTPGTLPGFEGSSLILPDVRIFSETEKAALHSYVERGKTLIIAGENATGLPAAPQTILVQTSPGKDYMSALAKGFEKTTPERERELSQILSQKPLIGVVASPMIATSIARVGEKPHVFFANFAGLKGHVNPVQTPQNGTQVTIAGATAGRGFFLPFLGEVQTLTGTAENGSMTYTLPAIEKGAVFWYEP
ncbi:MAG: family 10 glycosylhydrolase [Acidobacteriaceae bacterium]|nr:family 10 glycosylhydrolase [Acidobacteriaceae bacterium]